MTDDRAEEFVGEVLAIFVFPEQRAPATPLAEVEAVAGQGLLGDHPRKPNREVTLLSQRSWEEATAPFAGELPPEMRRANLLIGGDLAGTMGKRLRVGGAELLIRGETVPCERMNEARAGLRKMLSVQMRGGVFGLIVKGGLIRVGDRVTASDSAAEPGLQDELNFPAARDGGGG